MNKNVVLILLIVFAVYINSNIALAASVKINGLEYDVNNIHITEPEGGKPSCLALDFVIYNATDTRKLDIKKRLNFSLRDEFGNSYSCLPLAGDNQSEFLPGQSVYPKQSYITHLACELPVSKAKNATLLFDGSSLGIVGESQISIPFSLSNKDNNMSIRIVGPESGITVERGTLVHLNVIVTGPRPPDGIIIDAFDYTYEDRKPSLNNVYDLNIPNDFIIGPQSINVIAKWKKNPNSENTTSSDNIILNIRDASPVDVF